MVPRARSRVISRSTSAASCTPSAAVGSSSSSSRGLRAIALATATICRCPPDSVLTGRVVSRSGMPSRSSSRAASLCSATSENRCLRRSLPSITFAATSRFSLSARSCQTTRTPSLAAARRRPAATACPPTRIDPDDRGDVARDGPDQRGLARPRSRRRAPPPRPARSARFTPSSAVSRAEPHRERGHRELRCRARRIPLRTARHRHHCYPRSGVNVPATCRYLPPGSAAPAPAAPLLRRQRLARAGRTRAGRGRACSDALAATWLPS